MSKVLALNAIQSDPVFLLYQRIKGYMVLVSTDNGFSLFVQDAR